MQGKAAGNVVEVRGLKIGEGIPKICVPVMGTSVEALEKEAKKILGFPVDMVEWRVDFMEKASDIDAVLYCAEKLRKILGGLPLLFTFRTKEEGGERRIALDDYIELNKAAAASGFVDLLDVEMFRGNAALGAASDKKIQNLIAHVHGCKKPVIGSYHDFNKTPETDEIVSRLIHMQANGADIPKIAVMPKSSMDVGRLLFSTAQAKEKISSPIITMAMAGMGSISRVSGEFFGSAVTFGCIEKTSAPGQMPVDELSSVLAVLHNFCG